MSRATKIVATLGPASSDPEVLERLIARRRRRGAAELLARQGAGPHRSRHAGARQSAERVGKPVAHHGRPAGAEDPRRQVRGRQDRCSIAGPDFVLDGAAHRARQQRRRRPGLQGAAARRAARRHAAAQRRPARARRSTRCAASRCTPRRARRRAVEQQGHQQGRRRPDRAGADRQGHGRHQDRDELPVRVPGGELPEERHRHGDGAPAGQRGRRATGATSRR